MTGGSGVTAGKSVAPRTGKEDGGRVGFHDAVRDALDRNDNVQTRAASEWA